ncbi:uncharacterized protein LOC105196580 isoform X2 [Solenopsis invicta]|nr:uncharacterized protein LOC105196580 isoform X2 [Solenopsis invicta]
MNEIIDHPEYNYDDTRKSLPKCDVDIRETTDDAFEFNLVNEEGVARETEAIDYETATTQVGLENSKIRLDECKNDRAPSDLLKEFLKRMRTEVEAGRLETIFRVPGIGPSVSSERVTAVKLWLADCARRQEGLVGPRNIRHFLCPNLDGIQECECTS